MARLPNNPALLVMFTNYLVEVRKDGQGARTQLQLAQKAAPSLLDQFNIYTAQQLAKQLKRGTASTLLLCMSTHAHDVPLTTTLPVLQRAVIHWT